MWVILGSPERRVIHRFANERDDYPMPPPACGVVQAGGNRVQVDEQIMRRWGYRPCKRCWPISESFWKELNV